MTPDLAGLSKSDCANACNTDGCIILGSRQPRCAHPRKGGPPLELVNDRPAMEAFNSVCLAIGVTNIYEPKKGTAA